MTNVKSIVKTILNIFLQFCLSIIFMHFTIIWFGPLNFFDTFWSFFIVKIEMFIHCRTFLNQKNRTVHCELGISNMYTYLSTPCFMMQRGFKQLFVSKEFHKKKVKKKTPKTSNYSILRFSNSFICLLGFRFFLSVDRTGGSYRSNLW